MSQGIFEVQIINPANGPDRWITIQAQSRDNAKQQVAALGEIVGEVRLVSVGSSLKPRRVPQSEPLPSEAGAIALSWLGLLIGPLAVAGLIWGAALMSKTNNRRGTHALTVGIIMTALWGLWLALWAFGQEY